MQNIFSVVFREKPSGIKAYIYLSVAMWISYLALTFFNPNETAMERYDLTRLELFLIQLTVVVPILIYWFMGVYSALHISDYARKLAAAAAAAAESNTMRNIGAGIFILVFGIAFNSFIGTFRQFILDDASALGIYTIVKNYISIGFNLAAFWYIWKGSKTLVGSLRVKGATIVQKLVFLVPMVIVFGAYLYLLFSNPFRTTSTVEGINPVYYLSDLWIFFTIALPHMLTWFMGVVASVNFILYSRNTEGIIYKQFLYMFVKGIVFITILSIFSQFLSTVGYTLAAASLSSILFLIYILFIIMAFGYGYMASAAKKLKLIETVI